MKYHLSIQTLVKIFLLLLIVPFSIIQAEEDIFRKKHGKNAPNHFDPNNLTDREKWDSENFIHEGLSQRKLLDECSVDEQTIAACQGQAANKKFLGMSPSMVQAISRMYATVLSTAGGDLVTVDGYNQKNPKDKTSLKDDVPKKDDVENKGEKKTTDYCKYVAAGTEAVALTQQTLGQNSIREVPTSEETAQLDALHKAAREHENRSTQAKTQAIGWGVTTGCYAAMMATPGMNVSAKAWQNWAKLGASAVLTVFFKGQIDAHDEYKDKVLAIAEKMPGKGDCNSITQKDCYCAQEETKYDPKVCLPYLHQEELSKNTLRVACIGKDLKADPKCDCIKTDNCYDKEYMNTINGLKFGKSELGGVSAPFGNMARGRLTGANLGKGTSKLFAKAKTELRNLKNKIPKGPRKRLSPSGQKEEKALVKLGLPLSLANKLAARPIDSTMKNAISRFSHNSKGRYKSNRNKGPKSKVLRFSGGDGINKKKSRRKKDNNFLKNLRRKHARSSGKNNKVLRFATRAKNQAQINNNKGRIIFEIISHRYQTSGWRRLDIQE